MKTHSRLLVTGAVVFVAGMVAFVVSYLILAYTDEDVHELGFLTEALGVIGTFFGPVVAASGLLTLAWGLQRRP